MAREFSDEKQERTARIVRLPPVVLCLLLLLTLSTLTFAAKDISPTTAQIHNGKMYQNLSLIDGAGFTDEKLNSKTYRIYTNQSKTDKVWDFSILNSISNDNHLLDCSPISHYCDMKINITPQGRNLKLQTDVISGGWAGGSAAVSKVFFYQTINTTIPNIVSCAGGNESGQYSYPCVNGTTTIQITREQADLSQLYVDDGQQAQVVIRFSRPSLTTIDIRPKLFGKEYVDWAYWDGQACSVNSSVQEFNSTSMAGSPAWYDWGDHTARDGGNFIPSQNLTITGIMVLPYVSATTCYVFASDGTTQLQNGTFSNATGTPYCPLNYNMSSSTTYYIFVDSGGAVYHGAYLWALTYPNTFDRFSVSTGRVNGADNPTNWGPIYRVNTTINSTNGSCVPAATINSTAITPANNQKYAGGTTSINFAFNCSSNTYASMLANITFNGTANTTAIPATNGSNTTQAITFNQNGTWAWAVNCYNGTTNQTSAGVNIFSIENFVPNITAFSFSPNGSVYQLGPMSFNITATDTEKATTTLYYSVFKNGSNQTAMAGTATLTNNSQSTIWLDKNGPFNPTDYWNVSVFVSDGANQTAAIMSNNTTISNYFSNITTFAPPAYSDLNFQAYLNMTLSGAASASAKFYYNAINQTANSPIGPPVYTFSSNQPAQHATTLTNYSGSWYLTATLANGSSYSMNATSSIVSVNISGMFLCNASVNTPTIYYNIIDAITLLPVNGTLSATYTWTGDNGNILSNTFTQANNTSSVCITPASFNQATTAAEITTATGYLSSVVSVPSYNYTSAAINRTITLINSTFGGYYTFQTINQYGAAVPNAHVVINKSGTIILNTTSDFNGYVYSALQQLSAYEITASATGYQTATYSFIAGSITTNTIVLQALVPTSNATSPYQFINNVSYSISPAYHFFSTPTNLTLTIASSNNSLLGWGWSITRNGSVVDTQVSAVGAGGTIYYTAAVVGTYQVNVWFIQQGYMNFTPVGVLYFYGNNTGVMAAASTLQTGSVISPFTYYLIALICALMAAAYASQYVGGGAAIVGLIVLTGFTFLWPNGVVVNIGFADITTTMLTILTALITFAVFYLGQFGV